MFELDRKELKKRQSKSEIWKAERTENRMCSESCRQSDVHKRGQDFEEDKTREDKV